MSNKDSEESAVVKGAIPKTLKLQFKVLCVQKELEMSEVLEDLIEQWIQANAPVPKFCVDLSNQDSEDVKAYVRKSLKLQFKLLQELAPLGEFGSKIRVVFVLGTSKK